MPKPKLKLVDTKTGQVLDRCPGCAAKEELLDTAGTKISNLKGRISKLLQKAEEHHDAFPSFKKCHDYWRERCKHPRTTYQIEDFQLWLPHFEAYDLDTCLRAIDGAAYDCRTGTRKNGSTVYYNDWELIHRNGAKFREFVNRAPYHKPKPEHLLALNRAIFWLHPDWEPETIMAAAKERVRRWAR